MKNIVLCGFMGCGKTTVGKALSKLTNMLFIDTDYYIEEKSGMSIKEIFANLGEAHFRNLEVECANELSNSGGYVISTGGGMLLNQIVVDCFRQNGVIVFLDTPLDVILSRLKNDKSRPLLQRDDRDEYIPKLHRQRYPKYLSAADMVFDTSDKTAESSADTILTQLREKYNI